MYHARQEGNARTMVKCYAQNNLEEVSQKYVRTMKRELNQDIEPILPS